MTVLLAILLSLVAVFMMLLILVQRGKGGGLVGALGGMGGQSAFGTKAGDTFTRVTMWCAFIWIVLCAVTVRQIGRSASNVGDVGKNYSGSQPASSAPADGASQGKPANGASPPAEAPDQQHK